ncbi:DUF4097 family beta strand repeat-containing protein [Micromonospora sp. NPDC051925]|uniref:DUF4097 family beta strand repeat-containing protein n=1 Tax=Micromonospora sp. NPDC051925 TaxID=3364288 RepID=UPI0037CA7851
MALPRSAVALGATAALILATGCDTLSYRRLDFDTTEAAKITRITVRPGSGGVVVRATGPATGVRVKRVLRYQGDQPDTTYEITGDELVLDTDCGPRCSVSYEVTAPPGVRVQGEAGSGDVEFAKIGSVDFTLGSGNIQVADVLGTVRAETGSGNIEVLNVTGPVDLRTSSGDVTGARLGGDVSAETGSGDITLALDKPASARARAGSGDVELTVPAGRYRVKSDVGSGDTRIGVTDDPAAPLLLDLSTGSGNVTVTQR